MKNWADAARQLGTLSLLAAALAGGAQAADLDDSNWTSYNGTVDGQRYSPLDQINAGNAASLAEVCRLKVDDGGTFHSGLLLVGGTLYFTTAHDTLAVDAANCSLRWRNSYVPEQTDVFPVNRGLAYANGRLFRGTPDARLLAIDAATGKTVWQEQVGDPTHGEFFSSAPAAWEGLLIIGTAGGDWGVRGRVMAYDQATGREVWRFNTIPTGKETGAQTWKDAKSAHYGGGGTWTTYTLDMASGEVFIPVGNPAPDFSPVYRPGENLFTDTALVLDARTGALKWWYQLAPHDGHDLDLGAAPMLYWNSKGVPMMALGSKDGHIYGVDRETHKQVFRTPLTTIENPGVTPTEKGVHVCPGPLGGTEWNGPAYDAKGKAILISSNDWCAVLHSEKAQWSPGVFYIGGGWVMDPQGTAWVNAIDPDTGAIRWRFHADGPMAAGITPTAGGIAFTGDMSGNFLVLDSATGKPLLKSATGGALAGGVITYAKGGRQYVAFTSGNVSRLTFGVSGSPTLIVYGLPEKKAP